METRLLGNTDIQITPIVMGTWQAGKRLWVGIEDEESIKANHQFPEADNRAKNKLFQGENYQRAQTALTQLRPIAERNNCTLAQLALAWLIAQPQTQAIAAARNAQQASSNAQAVEVKLSEADIQAIDLISRQVTDYLDNNPLMWE